MDGNYGDATAVAVSQFQTDVGLTADGLVGPATWQRLLPTPTTLNQPQTPNPVGTAEQEDLGETSNSTTRPSPAPPATITASGTAGDLPVLRLDDYGPDVSTLQQRLAALNLYTGLVDGVFGLQTAEAVEQFQRQAGLGVDGVVGPATWAELLK
ncbi:peptidoglycan-binding protein [Leptothoe spongobia TAU-MAC 1115]|uniref:Peptidoglycan-binding protein n=1 Tax=Leptothoe spongobia TAU-MAC 1115 TaxID=1967444 RepID=A0A947DG09_9CYAN|nr:peptidoglycan-binding protein [Leptothoe spongobia TAU-MAC 1115]